MKLKISLLAILTATLITPTLSLAHDRDHNGSHENTSFHVSAFYAGNAYSAHFYDKGFRYVKYHPKAHHLNNRAHHSGHKVYLNHKGDRIDRRLDRKGERINSKLDRAAYHAWRQGDYKKARQLDRNHNS